MRLNLFLRHVANHWQLIHLSLVGLNDEDQPDDEPTQPHDRPNQHSQKAQGKVQHDVQPDPYYPPRDVEENRLPRVKAHEPVAAVRLNQQKDNRRDDGDIRQHSSSIIGKSRCGRGSSDDWPITARRAYAGAVRNLCSAHIAKRHLTPPSKATLTNEIAQQFTGFPADGIQISNFPKYPCFFRSFFRKAS